MERNWELEDSSSKVELIKALSDQLSHSDEPFLLRCLEETDQKIRNQAAYLLVQLDDSNYLKQILEFADTHLGNSPSGEIELDLPESIPKPIDAILSKHKEDKLEGVGKRTNAFYQVLSVIPPSYWQKKYPQKPLALLNFFSKSNWSQLLCLSIVRSVNIYQEDYWMEAMAHFLAATKRH